MSWPLQSVVGIPSHNVNTEYFSASFIVDCNLIEKICEKYWQVCEKILIIKATLSWVA